MDGLWFQRRIGQSDVKRVAIGSKTLLKNIRRVQEDLQF